MGLKKFLRSHNTRSMPKGIDYRTLIARGSPARGTHNFKIPSRKARLKLALILVSILLLFLYSISLHSWIYGGGTGNPYWEEAFITKDDEQHFNYNSSYFVNTAGCKMPSLPVMDDHIQKYVEPVDRLNCTPALIQSDSSSIWFQLSEQDIERYYDLSNTSMIQCCFRAFKRRSNNGVTVVGAENCFSYGERVSVDSEFIAVICTHPSKKQSVFYRDYFAFVPLKPKVEERCERLRNDLKDTLGSDEDKLGVMILGIDSVSRLNFHRQMPQTAETVVDRLKGAEMFGYNKVGDNTYPNLVPVLTGLDLDELAAACLPNSTTNNTFDLCPFIWHKFAAAGYRTFYAEDSSTLETFNYLRKGFHDQPTDYYLRNFFRQAESSIGYNKKVNSKLCLGGRNPTQILVEYSKKIVTAMTDRLSFALLWACTVTHDMLNYPSLIDEDYRSLLEHMEKEHFLENNAIILLSDHGLRWGSYRNTYQGMMEERQPFLFFILPRWFQQKYTTAYRNLRKNRQQLTSHFDLYETLKDLADLSSLSRATLKKRSMELLETKPIPRGISLFLPIAPTRTCEDAGIAAHWCTCHDHKPIATNDYRVITVTRYTVQSLNQMLKKYPQCSALHLYTIEDATLGISTEEIISKKPTNHFSDISVRFVTKPGGAEFEATIRIDSNNQSSLTGSVSRTNLYGKQSYCVDDYRMKLYCFCAR
ncbi:uncharacterized protein LOC128741363 [Sabethes cyaneus]|uniref:uncharacterized protein LOC128741363 n=1 Tax=Sabethes cyaneus TaxID=53552 RepID=UPI00237E74E2|nr:uncharacterized protein LOC128741363 [Sabethes cyaneus]